MTTERIDEPNRKPLRLWPGVAIVALIWLLRVGGPLFAPDAAVPVGMLAGAAGGVLVIVWWLLFSRAPWGERLGGVALMVAALLVTSRFLDISLARAGMGLLFYIQALPILGTAFVLWAVATRELPAGTRRLSMVATIVLACGVWTLIRTAGVTGSFDSQLAWRWSQTPEERLLALTVDEPALSPPAVASAGTMDTGAGWPGFRGVNRDSIIAGVRIETDWSASPPVELWRRPIGPGWSSFAVRGDLFYTQEQRGEDEIVAAYSVTTGEPVWRHADPVRFWEAEGGAGPRGTPTLRGDRLYALGATGILNVLSADNGTVVWSRNVSPDSGVAVPGWGFASSPLVVGDVVVVAAEGRLVAYDLAGGGPRWLGPSQGLGYSSPHLLEIDGVPQILLMGGPKATSVSPSDGTVLWEHEWPAGVRIVQPALTADGDLLISGGERNGMRRIAVRRGPGGWTTEERWTTNRLKPHYSDFVIHQGHAYGFDGTILACIDVETGERKWKGGRYGTGQLVLLQDQDVLLVVTEDGELALVAATPDQFTELARFPAMDGKTWNHPVLVGDLLLVRNGQEMVAFRLTLAD